MYILVIVLGIILLLVILLAVPLDLVFRLEKETEFKSTVLVRWLFGAVSHNVAREKKRSDGKRKKGTELKQIVAMLRTGGFAGKLFRFVTEIFRRLKIRELRLRLRLGAGDPAETGFLFAAIGPAIALFKCLPVIDFQVEPDFYRERFQGHFKGNVRVFPIQLVAPAVIFACSPATMKAIRAMAAARGT